mmetsp:Transcript_116735/g.203068  ORF Transcript_116735/g.203068 Transcript_116735/m.203068 type:complete len:314 (-) Transcript_116735:1361-2302(-)
MHTVPPCRHNLIPTLTYPDAPLQPDRHRHTNLSRACPHMSELDTWCNGYFTTAFLKVETHTPEGRVSLLSFQQATPSASVLNSFNSFCTFRAARVCPSIQPTPSRGGNVTCCPTSLPAGGLRISIFPSASTAQRTMPSDAAPLRLAVARLQITRTIAPFICSSVRCFARPLTICRGFSSPRSTLSTYSVSAVSCFLTERILPTRMSNAVTSEASFLTTLGASLGFSFLANSTGGSFSGKGVSPGRTPNFRFSFPCLRLAGTPRESWIAAPARGITGASSRPMMRIPSIITYSTVFRRSVSFFASTQGSIAVTY